MNRRWVHLLNWSAFLVLSVGLISAQSSFWMQVFGNFPPPNLWILIICYWALYRSIWEAISLTYILTLLVAAMSAANFGILVATHLMILYMTHSFRSRFFWKSSTYFMLVTGTASLLFPILYFLLCSAFEAPGLTQFAFFEYILRSLLTALLATPFFAVFDWVDRMTQKELPAEVKNE